MNNFKIGEEIIPIMGLVNSITYNFNNELKKFSGNLSIEEKDDKIYIKDQNDCEIMNAEIDKVSIFTKVDQYYEWYWNELPEHRNKLLNDAKNMLPEEFNKFKTEKIIQFQGEEIISYIEGHIVDVMNYEYIFPKKIDESYVLYCLYDINWQNQEIKPEY